VLRIVVPGHWGVNKADTEPLSKKLLERLPVVSFPSSGQVFRQAFGKGLMIKNDPGPSALLY
jgi:hypothetical protein